MGSKIFVVYSVVFNTVKVKIQDYDGVIWSSNFGFNQIMKVPDGITLDTQHHFEG
jgi:hypothetical protein